MTEPSVPTHPGRVLREYMGDQLTVSDFAEHLGVTRPALSMIVNGRGGISAEMAIKLSEAFGTSAELWMNLQSQYDLYQAEQKHTSVVKRLHALSAPAKQGKAQKRA